ncbi:MAG TPA: hypothetical protein P5560_12215, partial [Thermotogota bacterium]|nr:hypothetical protein [Thermotogota bacterium]HRW93706.1 hypothetical protein [Thermotogota bacterium]
MKKHTFPREVCIPLLLLVLFFAGCSPSRRIIQDVHELDGTVIGCILGYSSDLILTKDYPN